MGQPRSTHQLVRAETYGDGAPVADGVPGILDEFAQQSRAIFQAAAIFIAAVVLARLQEMLARSTRS